MPRSNQLKETPLKSMKAWISINLTALLTVWKRVRLMPTSKFGSSRKKLNSAKERSNSKKNANNFKVLPFKLRGKEIRWQVRPRFWKNYQTRTRTSRIQIGTKGLRLSYQSRRTPTRIITRTRSFIRSSSAGTELQYSWKHRKTWKILRKQPEEKVRKARNVPP